ncbi:hypothetical protein K438DRAFT_1772628 [Mycena galopus ATCC 62051]|nr:hypothetical protein K438DRAFT_1772628 [Mycena galopus ATCC 62051]
MALLLLPTNSDDSEAFQQKWYKYERNSPLSRVYNLRLLLVASLVAIAFVGQDLQKAIQGVDSLSLDVYVLCDVLQLLSALVICIHHTLTIFKWTARGLALIDLAAVVIEIGATVVATKEKVRTQGESKYIVFARALVLSCIGIGAPAFNGIYAAIIRPASAVVSTTIVPNFGTLIPWGRGVTGNATVFIWTLWMGTSSKRIALVANRTVRPIPVFWAWTSQSHAIMKNVRNRDRSSFCQDPVCLVNWPGHSGTQFPSQDSQSSNCLLRKFSGEAGAKNYLFGTQKLKNIDPKPRPLSALGVVHLFQRHALVRTWHEDFPAIYTEGGLPGSENAGIVAFIRERLVNVDEDPRVSSQESDETEAQEPATGSSSLKIPIDEEQHNPRDGYDGITDASRQTPSYRPLGYILDEIPLLDVDIGPVDIGHVDAPVPKRKRKKHTFPACNGGSVQLDYPLEQVVRNVIISSGGKEFGSGADTSCVGNESNFKTHRRVCVIRPLGLCGVINDHGSRIQAGSSTGAASALSHSGNWSSLCGTGARGFQFGLNADVTTFPFGSLCILVASWVGRSP